MTEEKFIKDVKTLEEYIPLYCKSKHKNQKEFSYTKHYKTIDYTCSVHLCEECNYLFNYAISRLQECPHEEKPRCRKCPNPCYDKKEWKKLAKIMIYSSFKSLMLRVVTPYKQPK